MPLIQRDLHLSPVEVGLLAGARFIGMVLLSIPAAAVVGALGIRRSISLMQALFGLTLVGLAGAGDRNMALATVAAGSASFAASNPATTTAVVMRFPAKIRAQAMNTKQVGVPIGNMLAALTFPVAAVFVGWRGAMVIGAVAAVVAAGFSWVLYGPDVRGQHVPAARVQPGLRILLQSSAVRLTTIMQGLLMIGQISMLAYFMVFLVSRHVALSTAAGYLVLMQVAGTVGRIFWGVATEHGFGGRRRASLIAVILLAAIGAGALAMIPSDPSPWLLGILAILLGLGLMSWAGMVELVRAELVHSSSTAAATGIGYSFASIGAVAGPPLFGLVVQWSGFPAAWSALAAVLLLAGVLGFGLTEPATLNARSLEVES
jgi:MFS family permease